MFTCLNLASFVRIRLYNDCSSIFRTCSNHFDTNVKRTKNVLLNSLNQITIFRATFL